PGVMTSRMYVLSGSQHPAVARTVMSRSVIMPIRRSSSPQTGSAPMSTSFIFCAAAEMLSLGRTHSGPYVITSRTCMADLLGLVALFVFQDVPHAGTATAAAGCFIGAVSRNGVLTVRTGHVALRMTCS